MSSTLPNDPVNSAHAVWYNRFAANLKTAVGDKVVVNYFPSDQLGKEADVVQQVRLGSVDMMISGSSIWATLMPEMGVLDLGYMFANNDHCGRALDGKAGTILGDMLAERTSVRARLGLQPRRAQRVHQESGADRRRPAQTSSCACCRCRTSSPRSS